MQEMAIGEARNHFSEIINQLRDGTETEFVIKNRDEPVAKIVPVAKQTPRVRQFGICKDNPIVLDWEAFDAMDEEIAKEFGTW